VLDSYGSPQSRLGARNGFDTIAGTSGIRRVKTNAMCKRLTGTERGRNVREIGTIAFSRRAGGSTAMDDVQISGFEPDVRLG
jgi:hypothetical protein